MVSSSRQWMRRRDRGDQTGRFMRFSNQANEFVFYLCIIYTYIYIYIYIVCLKNGESM